MCLFGPPASGKATIGQALARLTGFRLFHNHLTADPVASLFGWGGSKFDRLVDEIRDRLLDEASADPSITGVIFTFVWAFNLPEDIERIRSRAEMFTNRGGSAYFVELTATLRERISREGTPIRIGLKPAQRDVEAARQRQVATDSRFVMNTSGSLPLPYPHLVIDTEASTPDAAAVQIKAFIGGAASDA